MINNPYVLLDEAWENPVEEFPTGSGGGGDDGGRTRQTKVFVNL